MHENPLLHRQIISQSKKNVPESELRHFDRLRLRLQTRCHDSGQLRLRLPLCTPGYGNASNQWCKEPLPAHSYLQRKLRPVRHSYFRYRFGAVSAMGLPMTLGSSESILWFRKYPDPPGTQCGGASAYVNEEWSKLKPRNWSITFSLRVINRQETSQIRTN